jgi:hypothetical protein
MAHAVRFSKRDPAINSEEWRSDSLGGRIASNLTIPDPIAPTPAQRHSVAAMNTPSCSISPLSHLQIVNAAILAPSPDNNQPWRFVSNRDRLEVYLDPGRALPSDVNSMFDLLGLGAAVENARIAASQLGYETRVEYIGWHAPTTSQPAATLTFSPGGAPDPLSEHLATRCTCRKLYSTGPVSEKSLAAMADAARQFPEVRVDWVTDRPRIRALARLAAATDRIRFEYEPFHNELFRQLRFSAAEAEQTRDGLDLRTLELPPGAGFLLRQLRPWPRMKWLHRLGLGRLLTVPSLLSVRSSGALGVLSVAEPTSGQFLCGGRGFQRLWLAAQAEGLALQPLGSVSIFFAHLKLLQGRKLSPRHKEMLARLTGRFETVVPESGGRFLLLLFRLGHAPRPKFCSLRRPAEEVLGTGEVG